MGESIGIALQVYFLGFIIALAMAFLIKLILFIIRRGSRKDAAASAGPEDGANKPEGGANKPEGEAEKPEAGTEKGAADGKNDGGKAPEPDGGKDRREGAA
jgi:hypothetical protein